MADAAPPLTADLWARLKRLDGRYCISMWRDDQWLVPGPRNTMIWSGIGRAPAPHRRVWRVRIFEKGCAIHEILDAQAEPIADAVLAAPATGRRGARGSRAGGDDGDH
jgi:hypothetical protein